MKHLISTKSNRATSAPFLPRSKHVLPRKDGDKSTLIDLLRSMYPHKDINSPGI